MVVVEKARKFWEEYKRTYKELWLKAWCKYFEMIDGDDKNEKTQ